MIIISVRAVVEGTQRIFPHERPFRHSRVPSQQRSTSSSIFLTRATMLPNFNQAFGSVRNPAGLEPASPPTGSELEPASPPTGLELEPASPPTGSGLEPASPPTGSAFVTSYAPAPQVMSAVESSVTAGTSSDNDVHTMQPPSPRLPSFNQAFSCNNTRQDLGGIALPQASVSDGMIVTSAVQMPRVSSEVLTTVPIIPVAGSSSADEVYTLEYPPLYDADHICTHSPSLSPPQRHRPPSPPQQALNNICEAPWHRYSCLEDSQMQAKIHSELQRGDIQYEPLDLTKWSDRTAQETSRPPRPLRSWSQPLPLDFTSSNHPQEIQRPNSLPPKFEEPPLPTRIALRKVPDDELEHFWKDIMEYIIKDLQKMGLDLNALEALKSARS